MFAGPNGSGKSTLFNWLRDQNIDFGTYINPDEIAKGLEGSLAERSRQAQALADQARARCLDRRQDFSFETVMSHPSKVDFLELAGSLGYETVLYFVSTSDPELNVVRVSERV
jgi:predicted ABC-type ATPase